MMQQQRNPQPDPQTMTLRDAFELFNLPDLEADASPRTIENYETALKRWERLTDDPRAVAIDNRTLSNFKRACVEAGYAAQTFNGTWRSLRAILRRLGPQQYRNPLGEGIIERIPHVKMLKEDRAFPRIATFDELDRLYDACDSACFPETEVPPADLWRCALVVAYIYGPRYSDLWELRTEGISLADRTVRFQASKTKKWHVLPLNEIAFLHLRRIWSARERVFPVGPNYHGTNNPVRRQWKLLNEAAGVDPPIGFQTLRKTAGSMYDRTAPGTAAYILGHALRGVTATSYVNPLASGSLDDAVHSLPQPDSFRKILNDADRQVNVVMRCRRDCWEFRTVNGRYGAGVARYKRTTMRVSRTLLRLLQAFVSAGGRPLDFEGVRRCAFFDRPHVDDATVKGAVAELRVKLRRSIEMPLVWNPLPWDHDAGGWFLRLP